MGWLSKQERAIGSYRELGEAAKKSDICARKSPHDRKQDRQTQRIRAKEDASLGHFWMPVREDFLKAEEGRHTESYKIESKETESDNYGQGEQPNSLS